LSPLYLCLVFKDIVQSLESELVLGYLDDDASTVAADFIELEAAATMSWSIDINRSKCEIIGHTDDSTACRRRPPPNFPPIHCYFTVLAPSPYVIER